EGKLLFIIWSFIRVVWRTTEPSYLLNYRRIHRLRLAPSHSFAAFISFGNFFKEAPNVFLRDLPTLLVANRHLLATELSRNSPEPPLCYIIVRPEDHNLTFATRSFVSTCLLRHNRILGKRGALKGSVTRIETFIRDLDESRIETPEVQREIRGKLEYLNEIRDKLLTTHEAIISSNEEDPIQAEKFLNELYSTIDMVDTSLRVLIVKDTTEKNNTTSDNASNANSSGSQLESFLEKFTQVLSNLSSDKSTENSISGHVKLEPIKIPIFSGAYHEWPTFKDIFLTSIGNSSKLSDAHKMQYLVSFLAGEAKETVQHMRICDANYKAAWALLSEKYDDQCALINDNIQRFLAQPNIKTSSQTSIRQFRTTCNSILHSLDALNANGRDIWLVHWASRHLDNDSMILWAQKIKNKIPTWATFDEFLDERAKTLAIYTPPVEKSSLSKVQAPQKATPRAKPSTTALVTTDASNLCDCCKENPHRLFKCPKFASYNPAERLGFVKSHNLCRNCLGKNHVTKDCQSSHCKRCSTKHSTLLHDAFPSTSTHTQSQSPIADTPKPSTTAQSDDSDKANPQTVAISSTVLSSQATTKVFLATAIVQILDKDNNAHLCRAILDSGAQMNLMTQDLCQKLKLKKSPSDVVITGVTNAQRTAKFQTGSVVRSRVNNAHFEFDCLIVPKITGNLPNWKVDTTAIPIPPNLALADPSWNVTGSIDILIGASLYFDIVKDQSIKLGTGLPQLKNTDFGWIIVGAHHTEPQAPPEVYCCLTTLSSIDASLKKLCEVEEFPSKHPPTEEHKEVEKLYSETTVRDSTGRYVVHLPLRSTVENLADNKENAKRQFFRLEKRLDKDPQLKVEYSASIQQYLDQGFLEPIPSTGTSENVYYLPHHPVIKASSTTTKVRVVYNASSRSSTGLSLNDVLKIGPTVQPDVFETLLMFRRHPIALSADIRQMYPQFLLQPEYRDLQRIFWRNSKTEPLQEYRLTGVCFGVASSPFLATRSLNQLAVDEQQSYPKASHVLLNNFYVDDCLLSCPTIEDALETQQQLISITQAAGLVLTKWCSNRKELLQVSDDATTTSLDVPESSVGTLGMKYNPQKDIFHFNFISEELRGDTMREIFSKIARLYDPHGFLGPVIIRGKIFLQSLWDLKVKWDDKLPPEVLSTWDAFYDDLTQVSCITIPRWASSILSPTSEELHVFCDASTSAYGAALYYVTEDQHGRSSHLIFAKSKVAPKTTQTIPRLELMSAELAAQMMNKFREALQIKACFFWTDSMVVYHQIQSLDKKFDVFVAHRLGKIHTVSQREDWNHVPGTLNPADIISRGTSTEDLRNSTMWWHGAPFLLQSRSHWPRVHLPADDSILIASLITESPSEPTPVDFISKLIAKSSDYQEVTEVLAITLRFFKFTTNHRNGPISVEEIRLAELVLLKWDQLNKLSEVFTSIRNNTLQSNRAMKKIKSLSPFIDQDGIIRVGGRISQSIELYDTRHPILLPKGELARLIATHEHRKQMHPGPQLLLATLRQRVWPLGSRNLTRQVVHNCVRCFRCKPQLQHQFMGDLPQERVIATAPFHNTGVDFCGPFWIRPDLKRGGSPQKAYVCIFICLAIKAVHIELVSNLSCDAFIAALRRFAARRSAPLHIFSDNATNFTAADKELQTLLKSQSAQDQLSAAATSMNITWHFQPPRSPHHGGLWESAVKSLKHHLLRTIGDKRLTFEGFYTVLTQVESILNSRPLTPLTDDPSELMCLTPGHFLMGKPVNQIPDPSLQEIPLNHLDRWQQHQQMAQEFSRRWRLEYLTELQRRTKWFSPQPNLKIGDLVILHEDNSPTHHWPLGVIDKIHPGKDSKVRVVTVRTSKGCYKRSIAKVCRLPSTEDDQLFQITEDPAGLERGEHESANRVATDIISHCCALPPSGFKPVVSKVTNNWPSYRRPQGDNIPTLLHRFKGGENLAQDSLAPDFHHVRSSRGDMSHHSTVCGPNVSSTYTTNADVL
ncbi:uncharacterized protein LOC132264419, partial [Phlebotomus argentipes]|uniref:uncharacterized protein LOC132264419 n=1 Tax=Phlebotomus argentipes TaxID=94469 RepID=UPI0028929FB9